MKATIIVDIDGTIAHESPDGNHYNSAPREEMINEVNKLYDEGFKIVYWSARGTVTKKDWTELTEEQLRKWGVKYDELILYKPNYKVWIDDRAYNPHCSECMEKVKIKIEELRNG